MNDCADKDDKDNKNDEDYPTDDQNIYSPERRILILQNDSIEYKNKNSIFKQNLSKNQDESIDAKNVTEYNKIDNLNKEEIISIKPNKIKKDFSSIKPNKIIYTQHESFRGVSKSNIFDNVLNKQAKNNIDIINKYKKKMNDVDILMNILYLDTYDIPNNFISPFLSRKKVKKTIFDKNASNSDSNPNDPYEILRSNRRLMTIFVQKMQFQFLILFFILAFLPLIFYSLLLLVPLYVLIIYILIASIKGLQKRFRYPEVTKAVNFSYFEFLILISIMITFPVLYALGSMLTYSTLIYMSFPLVIAIHDTKLNCLWWMNRLVKFIFWCQLLILTLKVDGQISIDWESVFIIGILLLSLAECHGLYQIIYIYKKTKITNENSQQNKINSKCYLIPLWRILTYTYYIVFLIKLGDNFTNNRGQVSLGFWITSAVGSLLNLIFSFIFWKYPLLISDLIAPLISMPLESLATVSSRPINQNQSGIAFTHIISKSNEDLLKNLKVEFTDACLVMKSKTFYIPLINKFSNPNNPNKEVKKEENNSEKSAKSKTNHIYTINRIKRKSFTMYPALTYGLSPNMKDDKNDEDKKKQEDGDALMNISISFIKNKSDINSDTCCICFSNPPDSIFMDCGHGGVCVICAVKLIKKKNGCYLCRSLVKYVYFLEYVPDKPGIISAVATIQNEQV